MKRSPKRLYSSKPFSPPLRQSLAKSNHKFSLLTKFSKLKFDHRFGCPFHIKTCTPTFVTFRAILTPSSPTLAKINDEVSLLTNFSDLKFDHRLRCPFDRYLCTPTFTMFCAIFTPCNRNLSETA